MDYLNLKQHSRNVKENTARSLDFHRDIIHSSLKGIERSLSESSEYMDSENKWVGDIRRSLAIATVSCAGPLLSGKLSRLKFSLLDWDDYKKDQKIQSASWEKEKEEDRLLAKITKMQSTINTQLTSIARDLGGKMTTGTSAISGDQVTAQEITASSDRKRSSNSHHALLFHFLLPDCPLMCIVYGPSSARISL